MVALTLKMKNLICAMRIIQNRKVLRKRHGNGLVIFNIRHFSSSSRDNEGPPENEPRLICEFGAGPAPEDFASGSGWRPQPLERLVRRWGSLWHPRAACGSRAYALVGPLADLHDALLEHARDTVEAEFLREEDNFEFLDSAMVPDIVPRSTTRACGVVQQPGAHPIQYSVPGTSVQDYRRWREALQRGEPYFDEKGQGEMCLSGTAEMGISHLLKGRIFHERQLPAYFCAESRCFRPETSNSASERGLYRVHEFTKVEMFAVCTPRQSPAVLERIISVQRAILSSLGIRLRLLEMPREELGPAAVRKFDIEAWMPGRGRWGELTSASNCEALQAQGLGIRYRPLGLESKEEEREKLPLVHTCNGTALAASRALIAVVESAQRAPRGRLELPEVIARRLPTAREQPEKKKRGREQSLRMTRAPLFHYDFGEEDEKGEIEASWCWRGSGKTGAAEEEDALAEGESEEGEQEKEAGEANAPERTRKCRCVENLGFAKCVNNIKNAL